MDVCGKIRRIGKLVRGNLAVRLRRHRLLPVAYHEEGSMVTSASPARRGELITVLGTGFGSYVTPTLDGMAIPVAGSFGLVSPVQMKAGDQTLLPEWAGAAVGVVGVTVEISVVTIWYLLEVI